jgi:hypothetical protein
MYERVDMRNEAGIRFDRADRRATELLVEMGARAAADADVRRRVAPFFTAAATGSSRLVSGELGAPADRGTIRRPGTNPPQAR